MCMKIELATRRSDFLRREYRGRGGRYEDAAEQDGRAKSSALKKMCGEDPSKDRCAYPEKGMLFEGLYRPNPP